MPKICLNDSLLLSERIKLKLLFLSLLLSSVSAEGTQDRTDRVLLTPWVKFLWEAYRNVLDLLRNNNRVERLYQDTAQQGNQVSVNEISAEIILTRCCWLCM